MEVSSHGIAQQRVLGLEFGAAVFTNLTRDHLDFHKTLESYFEVKTRLFTGEVGPVPQAGGRQPRRSLRRGAGGEDRGRGAVRAARDLRRESAGAGARRERRPQFPGHVLPARLAGRRGRPPSRPSSAATMSPISWPRPRRPGRSGATRRAFIPRMRDFKGVPGRMERIEEGQPFNVLVDYAHTDDALRNALGMLRAITPGRLLVVFGCGGNRDRTKRPRMVRAVQEFADHAFATADNPRGEPLERIFGDMREGVIDPSKITWIDDRRRAISLALDSGAGRRQPADRRQGPRGLPGVCRHGDSLRRPAGRARADRGEGAAHLMPSFDSRPPGALGRAAAGRRAPRRRPIGLLGGLPPALRPGRSSSP